MASIHVLVRAARSEIAASLPKKHAAQPWPRCTICSGTPSMRMRVRPAGHAPSLGDIEPDTNRANFR